MNDENTSIRQSIEDNFEIHQAIRRSDFALQIREKMIEKCIKNADVAARAGVSEANISRWLRGNQNITIDTMYLLADAIQEKLSITVGSEQLADAKGKTYTDWQVISDVGVKLIDRSRYALRSSDRSKISGDFSNENDLLYGERHECSAAVN